MKLTLHILGMTLLGLAALSVPAWLIEVRSDRPIRGAEFATVEPPTGSAPSRPAQQNPYVEGIRRALTSARLAFEENHRASAMHATDAALRAAQVAHYGLEPRAAFEQVTKQIERARRVVQNGSPERAVAHLDRALEVLHDLEPERASDASLSPENAYRNARVIHADGSHLGELLGIEGKQGVIATDRRNLFGFIDWPAGKTRRVSTERLLPGKPRALGATMVTLAPG
jgi:hypothetical protein